MRSQVAEDLRARAAQARRIAVNMHNPQAELELTQMADDLDAEANLLDDSGDASLPISPPISEGS